MSGPALFFAFCVFFLFVEINCIQNHRPHTETQWRLNNRQDLYSHPRLLVWKPVLPQHLYMNPKTPMLPGSMPINYNRYGFSHLPAQLKPQSYIFAMPTPNQKLQPYGLNEMAEKRKPGNFHHITIINAVIPKPHFPPPTSPTTQFFPTYPKYRNNKHLYHPYLNKLTGWNNISRIPIVAQQYQPIYGNMPIASSSTAISKPIIDNYNIVKEREPKSYSCFGKSLPKDSIQIASTHSCETIPQGHNVSQQKIIPLPQQTTKVEVSTPSTPPSSSFKPDVVETTTQKIFLPTPIAHHPISSTTPPTIVTSNFITFVPLRQNEASSTRKEAYHHRQQHNFFTLEDAITKPPSINQIFNDPWEAFKHAQSQQQNSMRLQSNAHDTLKTTKQSFMHNFFDDNYDTLETQQIDDYTNFDKGYNDPDPYYVNTNEYVAPIRNRIIDENQNKENLLHETHLRYKQANGNQYQYISTSPPYRYTGISKSKTTTLIPTSAEIPTSKPYNLIKYTTPQSLLDDTTTTRLIEDQTSDSPLTTTSISDHSKLPVYTTVATSTTTRENIFKKTKLKRPFYQGQNATHKYPKTIRGLFKPNKNSTSTTSTTKRLQPPDPD
ncbi:uncharacterized protein LOC105262541 [Musca domestica]|uniref:Uncharacterized protein LOC105262541 n=1 Tax=Musca domestica TaxID=7370 RepID=A0A1I8NJY4_MUSDO|nr:uncharacterized protein LOC105262541 [Musca domestica]